jgi:hypothetical protein
LLITLTQVCRFFAVVFMPVLLRSRTISLEHVHAARGFWKRIEYMRKIDIKADFASALVRKDPLANSQIRHVEECIIFYPLFEPRSLNTGLVYVETHAVALLTVIRTLPCTIKSLSLQNVPISHEFLMALRALTNLESLTLSSVVLASEFVSNQSAIRIDLKSISLSLCDVDYQPSRWTVMKSLSTFINLDSIRILRTDDRHFLDVVVSQCKTLHVEKLHLNMMRLEHHSNITQLNYQVQMPYLITLTIDVSSRIHVASDLSPVLKAFMPKLQNLRCPVFIAQHLIPGRPLENIDIYSVGVREDNISEPSALLRLIQLSTAPIKKLHIPTFVYLASPREFGNTFPDLDELTLTLRSKSDTTDTVRHSNSSAIIITLI